LNEAKEKSGFFNKLRAQKEQKALDELERQSSLKK
jgi:hypothetical protein